MYYIVGLGNPGEEYENTRHNTGRMIVQAFAKSIKAGDFEFNKKSNALVAEGKIGKEKFTMILPETMMNNSGNAVVKFITSKKKAENLIVAHDDLDLSLGKFKISFARGFGGHRGVESIIKKIKTEEFIRIRVGICPKKKPIGKDLFNFLLGKFSPKELLIFKKNSKKIISAIETIITEGLQRSMSDFN